MLCNGFKKWTLYVRKENYLEWYYQRGQNLLLLMENPPSLIWKESSVNRKKYHYQAIYFSPILKNIPLRKNPKIFIFLQIILELQSYGFIQWLFFLPNHRRDKEWKILSEAMVLWINISVLRVQKVNLNHSAWFPYENVLAD